MDRVRPSDAPDPAAERLVTALGALYAYPATEPGRPWVRANMVTSADGAATAGGRSGGLSGPADRLLFSVLRSLADVIVVGASTARIERYGPPAPAATWPQLRRARAPLPTIAIVTSHLDLDPDSPLLNPPPDRPQAIILTTEASPQDRRAELSKHAEVVIAGEKRVDPATALTALTTRGYTKILTEGGPALLGQFAAAAQLHDLCLTIAPKLEGGHAPRIITEPKALASAHSSSLKLLTVLEDTGTLLCRYQVG